MKLFRFPKSDLKTPYKRSSEFQKPGLQNSKQAIEIRMHFCLHVVWGEEGFCDITFSIGKMDKCHACKALTAQTAACRIIPHLLFLSPSKSAFCQWIPKTYRIQPICTYLSPTFYMSSSFSAGVSEWWHSYRLQKNGRRGKSNFCIFWLRGYVHRRQSFGSAERSSAW